MTQRKHLLAPAALALVAFLVRFRFSGYDRIVWGDEPFYLWLGRNWLAGRGYSFAFTGHFDYHHTPGYPLISALLFRLTGDLGRASEWSHILFGVLLTLALYALARRIYGPVSALAAGGLAALTPATALMPLFWGTATETPYLALVVTGLFFAHRVYQHWRWADSVLAALFLALAYYVRPEGIVFWGAIGLILGLRALARPPRLRRLAHPALIGVLFLLFLTPYLWQVRQATGQWMLSQKVGAHFATAQGLSEGSHIRFDQETWGLDSSGREVWFFSEETANASALDYILADPGNYARVLYSNARKLLSQLIGPRLLPAFLAPFLFLALFRRAWDRRRLGDEGFLLITLLPGLSFILFLVLERYIVALIPTLLIWAGHGVAESGAWLQETARTLAPARARLTRGLAWLPIALLFLFLALWTPRQLGIVYFGGVSFNHLQAGAALAPAVAPGDIVMSRYPAIAFHAGAEWVPTPAADLAEVLAYARHKGVDFWAIAAEEAASLRPQFLPLLAQPDAARPGLTYLLTVRQGEEAVALYRLAAP